MANRIDLDHLHLTAWTERRAGETAAGMAANAVPQQGATTSLDGRCLRCRGGLMALERQPHLDRDWCWCPSCGASMPATIGAAGEVFSD